MLSFPFISIDSWIWLGYKTLDIFMYPDFSLSIYILPHLLEKKKQKRYKRKKKKGRIQ